MSFGWGPASGMVKSVNKQRGESVKRSLKDSSANTDAGEQKGKALKYKEATPELLAEIRADMQKVRKNRLLGTLIFAAVLISLIMYVLLMPIYS